MTELTSQPGISVLPAGPQSALAQHATPVALTAKQFATAVLSSARLLNDDDDDGDKPSGGGLGNSIDFHALGGPSVDEVLSTRVYDSPQALA